jgi:hypothetical protein
VIVGTKFDKLLVGVGRKKSLAELLQTFLRILESLVYVTEQLPQLLLNKLRIVVQSLAQLDTKLVNLLLHQK